MGVAATAMQRCHLHFHLRYGRCDTTLQATICLSIWAFASLYGPGSDAVDNSVDVGVGVGVDVGVGVMSEGKLVIFMRIAGAMPHQMRHLRADADLPRGVCDAINKRRAPGLQLPCRALGRTFIAQFCLQIARGGPCLWQMDDNGRCLTCELPQWQTNGRHF
ncbi:hypothetical protein AWZ03_012316 [Drosophila navojoa]|uniref:Uncharacterized protein n=1 Tax=Drosophila navojoa TaxID=7232 RepID=A0A484AXC3_DRONA|nr:hypothetical protein AWZ03_012316 [Drosophila navojoa]